MVTSCIVVSNFANIYYQINLENIEAELHCFADVVNNLLAPGGQFVVGSGIGLLEQKTWTRVLYTLDKSCILLLNW